MGWIHYPVATWGTVAVIVAAPLVYFIGRAFVRTNEPDHAESYRKRKFLLTMVTVVAVIAIGILWARLLQHTGTFLGILGAGLAVALREPLLSIAGRIAIFAGHIYSVGDRIELNKMSGDVIDVGFFYTRMMEIGNWVGGDQPSGRIVQFANAEIFGTAVFNYTQNFSYIWDEIRLPITYGSNLQAARQILLEVGNAYTKEFLEGVEEDLERMRQYFLVGKVEVKPHVFITVTDNWVELKLRYITEPKKRRIASTFMYEHMFEQVQHRKDIAIASSTMEVTVHPPKTEAEAGQPGDGTQQPRAA